MSTITVGIGELAAASGFDSVLRTISLGSCVAVVVVDRVRGVTGLAHVVLPQSDDVTQGCKPAGYFADLAVPRLMVELGKWGAGRRMGPLHVLLIGGGRPGGNTSSVFNIGARNVAAARLALESIGLVPSVEDIGGAWSRTVTATVGSVVVTCPDRPPLHL